MSKKVSIIIPCFNESATIKALLDALHTQTFPQEAMEVIIADGKSTDGTPQIIADWQKDHPDLLVKVCENPKRIIPAALNVAIQGAQGEFIIRLDAHSKPESHYIARSVAALEAGSGENVGGVWHIQPSSKSWIAKSIAAAAGHPIGVGDARYRYTDQAGTVDTVPFGAFKRSLIDEIGLFDENLLTNEDYEFNTRIRQNGGRIYLDPAIQSTYFARSNLRSLAKQYWRYGYWKVQMLRRYPETIRWRQAIPPLFVLGLIVLAGLTPFWALVGWLLLAIVGLYTLVISLAGLQLAVKNKAFALWVGVPLAIACMHFAWGTAFLWGLIHPPKSK